MSNQLITPEQISEFEQTLHRQERSPGTVENYLRHIRAFARWVRGRPVTQESASAWKESLRQAGYAPATINAMLAALNAFFRSACWEHCRVKALRIQRRLFREDSRELTRPEYQRLVATARGLGRERLALLLESICATGIRVSEVRYLTVEAAGRGRAEISLKGKIRAILLPDKLCRKLLKYARKNNITSGEVFLTRGGKSMGRCQIWTEMKRLCQKADVEPSKVFPHNLRHLFATIYYRVYKDIAKLADILGHSSIETTCIYLMTTGQEHRRQLERLQLVL